VLGRRKVCTLEGADESGAIGREALSVALVDVAEVLVVAAEADVIRKIAIRGRTAELEIRLMVECGPPDTDIRACESGIGARSNDLIDEARETLAFGVRGCGAGVDLKLLLAQ